MKLNVVYSSDDNYAKLLGVSIMSLIDNNVSDFSEININIIANGISNENIKRIENICSLDKVNLFFYNLKDFDDNLNLTNNFSRSAYGRLFLDKFDMYDKILYLDCDVLVISSLKELFEIEIKDFYLAGVQDNASKYYRDSINLDKKIRYINSGVLLINVKKWNHDDMETKAINCINSFNGSVPHHDQGVINKIIGNKRIILNPKYNVMNPMFLYKVEHIKSIWNIEQYYTQAEIDYATQNPCCVHFTMGFFNRPWNQQCTHPFKNEYLKYYNNSPWKEEKLGNIKVNWTIKLKYYLYRILPFKLYLFLSNYNKK